MKPLFLSDNKEVMFINGEIAFNTALSLQKEGDQLIKQVKGHSLMLNLNSVKKSDFTGLALMIRWQRLCRRLNINFKICHPPASIIKMAEVCGVKNLLSIE